MLVILLKAVLKCSNTKCDMGEDLENLELNGISSFFKSAILSANCSSAARFYALDLSISTFFLVLLISFRNVK